MKVFIVYWHPEPQSFNHAMFETAVNTFKEMGAEVKTSDLFEMNFDPVSSRKNFKTVKNPDFFKPPLEERHATKTNSFSDEIETEIAKMEWCDLMIWQFPLWWFGLPAVLKGWVDRIFAQSRCYSHARIFENGVFKGKKAMLSTSTGASIEAFRTGGLAGDPIKILSPIHRGIFRFTGYDVLMPHIVHAPERMTEEARKYELSRYSKRLQRIKNEKFLEVAGF